MKENKEELNEIEATTKSEIRAWYLFDWANSPYNGIAISLFIPLLLTELAEENVCKNVNCDINGNNIINGETVQVRIIGNWFLKPASYASLVIGISAFIQAIVYIQYSSLADYGDYRRKLFNITNIIGSILCMLFIVIGGSSLYLFAGLMTVILTCIGGIAIILYNSYLTVLVDYHPDILEAKKSQKPKDEIFALTDTISDSLSGCGFIYGYAGGFVVILICFAIVLFEPFAYVNINVMDVQSFTSIDNSINNNVIFKEELFAKIVQKVNVYYQETNSMTNEIEIYGVQFMYDNIIGDIHGTTTNTNMTYDFSSNKITKAKTFTYNGNVVSIQFYISEDNRWEIIGNISDKNAKEYTFDPFESRSSYENYQLSGISSESNKETFKLISHTLLFSDINANGPHFLKGKSNFYDRIGIFVCGIWWLIFSLIGIKYLKNVIHAPLPKESNVCTFGCIETFQFCKKVKEYPQLFKYLVGYFFFSDGINTFLNAGALFSREVLNMTAAQIAIQVLQVYVIGSLGNYMFLKIQNRFGIDGKKMLLFHIIFLAIYPLYLVIGAIPNAKFGAVSIPEFYIFNAFYALNIGSIQSYSRGVFAQLVPREYSCELFGLYEITNKGSSWIGPIVVAVISDTTNFRYTSFYICFVFLLSVPFIYYTDMDQGRSKSNKHKINSPKSLELQLQSSIHDYNETNETKETNNDANDANETNETNETNDSNETNNNQ